MKIVITEVEADISFAILWHGDLLRMARVVGLYSLGDIVSPGSDVVLAVRAIAFNAQTIRDDLRAQFFAGLFNDVDGSAEVGVAAVAGGESGDFFAFEIHFIGVFKKGSKVFLHLNVLIAPAGGAKKDRVITVGEAVCLSIGGVHDSDIVAGRLEFGFDGVSDGFSIASGRTVYLENLGHFFVLQK